MATIFSPTDLNSKPILTGNPGAVIYDGKITATVSAATDTLRFLKVPAGTRVLEINARLATAFATAWTGNWQLVPCDGVSVPIIGGSGTSAVLSVVGAVTGAGAKYPISFEPVTTKVDCFLDLQLATNTSTAANGVATLTLLGMATGAA